MHIQQDDSIHTTVSLRMFSSGMPFFLGDLLRTQAYAIDDQLTRYASSFKLINFLHILSCCTLHPPLSLGSTLWDTDVYTQYFLYILIVERVEYISNAEGMKENIKKEKWVNVQTITGSSNTTFHTLCSSKAEANNPPSCIFWQGRDSQFMIMIITLVFLYQ